MPATNGAEPAPAGGHNSQAGAVLTLAAAAADEPGVLLRAAAAEVRAEPIPPMPDVTVPDRPLGVDVADRVGVVRDPLAPDWLTAVIPAVRAVVGVAVMVKDGVVEYGPVVADRVAVVVAVVPVGVAPVCAAVGIGSAAPSSAVRHVAPR